MSLRTTATFLFTDIEGSTAQWEVSPDMHERVTHHFDLLCSAVADEGGEVFATMGDGIAAAFTSADAAARAAINGQRQMATSGLSVRMGLHTGEARFVDGDYRGRPVNRAARIMDVGHGGQILVSDRTAGLLRDDPCPIGLADLHIHALRDLAEPEHVWQVVHPDLPLSFPPLRSLEPVSSNGPTPRSSFVGRHATALLDRVGPIAEPVLATLATSPIGSYLEMMKFDEIARRATTGFAPIRLDQFVGMWSLGR